MTEPQPDSSDHSQSTEFSSSSLHGILLPFPTPFKADRSPDLRALRENVVRWNETGVAGYVALGSTGERVHLGSDECLKVIEATVEAISESTTLIIGAGQQSTRGSIEDVRHCADAGADAVLVITPHFYRAEMTQDALLNQYHAVADSSPVPVILYSVPQFTGVTIAPETVAKLSEHQNIVGVKDSSGDIPALAEMVRLVPDDFAVLTGNGSALYPALDAGAKGGILAVGCIAPRLAVEIYDAFQSGEREHASLLQDRLTSATRGILGKFGISGLKAALDLLGYAGGHVRPPLRDASEEARTEISNVLVSTGLIEGESGVRSLKSGV